MPTQPHQSYAEVEFIDLVMIKYLKQLKDITKMAYFTFTVVYKINKNLHNVPAATRQYRFTWFSLLEVIFSNTGDTAASIILWELIDATTW